ncbi:MAG TPA: DUF3881 family protein [Lachnospiraceae bacterium]
MHTYLRTVGFSSIERKNLEEILSDVKENYDHRIVSAIDDNYTYAEFYKYYGHGFGIAVCGELDENDLFKREYYFPFFRGSCISTQEEITVEKHVGKDSFAGACDDPRVGVSIMFYVQNAGEYIKEMMKEKMPIQSNSSLSLSGLSTSATILLPIKKTVNDKVKNQEKIKNRSRLMSEAKEGNQEAIESLTLEDIDTYSMISKRIVDEDIYTIVENYFMPYGIESDQYHIMGEIISVEEEINKKTNERIYLMELEINELSLDVIVNEKDLVGHPEVGRRFKGSVWLQGYINF